MIHEDLITYSFNDVLIGYLRYGKTDNKKRAVCFATWLQNELNVARFTTHENQPFNLISCKVSALAEFSTDKGSRDCWLIFSVAEYILNWK